VRLKCEQVFAAVDGERAAIRPGVPCVIRGVLPALRICLISGFLISEFAFAFQTGPPVSGGSQGPFTSSGAPANTAGPQGPFMSSGAPANTAGPQAAVAPTGVVPGFDPALEDQQTKLAGIDEAARAGNLEALRQYLQDTDAAVQAAAFEALLAKDEHSAIRDLLAIVRDTKQLTRLQALQLLDSSPQVDEQTVRATLRNALVDPDPLLSQYALVALAVRDAGGQ
jgi:hypothetical protein